MKFSLLLLLSLVSCAPDKPEDAPVSEVTEQLNLDRSYSKAEIAFACETGCSHHYKIYLNANKIVKNAVSLNEQQLNSIQTECNRFCNLDVFYKLNQEQIKLSPIEPEVVEPKEESPEVEVKESVPAPVKKTGAGKVKSLEDL